MNLLQSCKNTFKALVIVLTTCLFFFPTVAIASTNNTFAVIIKEVSIKNGSLEVHPRTKELRDSGKVSAAIVSLPEGESGTINSIKITGPNNNTEFGCENIDVVNGTDLIKACGGIAYLEKGETTYEAMGSNFKPDTTLKIALKIESHHN